MLFLNTDWWRAKKCLGEQVKVNGAPKIVKKSRHSSVARVSARSGQTRRGTCRIAEIGDTTISYMMAVKAWNLVTLEDPGNLSEAVENRPTPGGF